MSTPHRKATPALCGLDNHVCGNDRWLTDTENGMDWNHGRYNVSKCFWLNGYHEIMTIPSRNIDNPRRPTNGGGGSPSPWPRVSPCIRGLGRSLHVFQLTWLNGIALAHSFHPSTRWEISISSFFFPPLSPLPLPPRSPLPAPESPLHTVWYQVTARGSRTRAPRTILLSRCFYRSSGFAVIS